MDPLISRRSLVAGAGAVLLTPSIVGAMYPRIVTGTSTPVILPNTPLADHALKGSSGAYVSLGNMAFPAGDWCIALCLVPPTTVDVDYFALSVGAASAGILTNNSTLTLGWPGAAGVPFSSYGWSCIGADDAGNPLSGRNATMFASAKQNGISGPQQNAGASDGVARMVFVQKQGATISFWIVAKNCTARQYQNLSTSFGAITAQPATLGGLNTASTPTGLSTISYQRFFFTTQALNQFQMEAIASGVDPRAVVTVNTGTDLLWSFPSVPTNGQTFADLIQGQVATANGTFATATALLPTTIDQNQIRFDADEYQIHQSNVGNATTNFYFSGTVYGADGTIQVQLMDHTNTTIIVPFASVGTSSNGTFSGLVNGVTTQLADFVPRAQKVIGGTPTANTYTATTSRFSSGPLIHWTGQSLAEEMRTLNNHAITGVLNLIGRVQSSQPSDLVMEEQYAPGWMNVTAPGYGDGYLIQLLGNALNTQCGMMNDAVSGSSIEQWLADTIGFNSFSAVGMLTNAKTSQSRFRARHSLWHQGENDSGNTQLSYYNNLTSLYNIYSANAAANNISPWYFWVVPVNNNYINEVNYSQQLCAIRSAQIKWALDQIAGGNNQVVLAFTVNDVLLENMQPGGIHANDVPMGYGFWSERAAQTLLFLEGKVANSGLGPQFVSATWNGATGNGLQIVITWAQNGGTGLQTPNAGSITGLTASETVVTGLYSPLVLGSTLLNTSNHVVTDATHTTVTLPSAPATAPYLWYQFGQPGPDANTSDTTAGLSNALYDNRAPLINTALGFPAVPMWQPVQCTSI